MAYLITFPRAVPSDAFLGLYRQDHRYLRDSPINLTGMTLNFQITDKRGWPKLKASTVDGSITILDVGIFRWVLQSAADAVAVADHLPDRFHHHHRGRQPDRAVLQRPVSPSDRGWQYVAMDTAQNDNQIFPS